MVTEIRERSIMVAKKEGNHVSLGTYSDVPSDLHAQGFGKPEEIFLGGKGDGKILHEYEVRQDELAKQFTVNVKGVHQLMFLSENSDYSMNGAVVDAWFILRARHRLWPHKATTALLLNWL